MGGGKISWAVVSLIEMDMLYGSGRMRVMSTGTINHGVAPLLLLFLLPLIFIPAFIYWLLFLKKYTKKMVGYTKNMVKSG